MARILIVEDQKIMQKYFEFIILQDPDLKLVDTISDAHEAVKICNYSVIDPVLMDVQTFHNHAPAIYLWYVLFRNCKRNELYHFRSTLELSGNDCKSRIQLQRGSDCCCIRK